jgi:hypothetical protein
LGFEIRTAGFRSVCGGISNVSEHGHCHFGIYFFINKLGKEYSHYTILEMKLILWPCKCHGLPGYSWPRQSVHLVYSTLSTSLCGALKELISSQPSQEDRCWVTFPAHARGRLETSPSHPCVTSLDFFWEDPRPCHLFSVSKESLRLGTLPKLYYTSFIICHLKFFIDMQLTCNKLHAFSVYLE